MHIKLFEDFLNESSKTSDALIDMLCNSMENYSDEKEFIDAAIKGGFSKSESKLLKDIYNKYWDLDAKKRNDYTAKDWAEWLKKSTHGWALNEGKTFLSKDGDVFVWLQSTNRLQYQIPAIFGHDTEFLDADVKNGLKSGKIDAATEEKMTAAIKKASDDIREVIMDAEKQIAKIGENAAKEVNKLAK
jgi:hypothetical protein